ncbi:MAG: hypothetical protein LH468_05485 [Nocardioides sp.]|nr:hypothetical protein [Nocardioides sp.]
MTFFIILLLLALVMGAGTVRELFHDGRGLCGPPASHLEDRRFRSPRLR